VELATGGFRKFNSGSYNKTGQFPDESVRIKKDKFTM
jgi:hypothetical protein